MSVDSGTDSPTRGVGTPDVGCSLCERSLDGSEDLFVVCYPEDGCRIPSVAAADGLVAACGECAGEIADLVAAWSGHEDPPVAADHSISAGYRRVAGGCSFCDGTVDDAPLLGVEYYRPGDGDADHADAGDTDAGATDADAGDVDAHDASIDDAVSGPEEYANHSLCGNCQAVFEEFLRSVRADAPA